MNSAFCNYYQREVSQNVEKAYWNNTVFYSFLITVVNLVKIPLYS